MSHFTRVQTQIADTDALVCALQDEGYEVEVHEQGTTLRGFLGQSRQGQVVVRREQLPVRYSDLGFERQPDGIYRAWIDSDLAKHDPALLSRVTARSAYHATMSTLSSQGFALADEQRAEDGTVRLVLRRTT